MIRRSDEGGLEPSAYICDSVPIVMEPYLTSNLENPSNVVDGFSDVNGNYKRHVSNDNSHMCPESYDNDYRHSCTALSGSGYNHQSEDSTAYDISTPRSSSCPPINSTGFVGYETHNSVSFERGPNGAAYDGHVFIDDVGENFSNLENHSNTLEGFNSENKWHASCDNSHMLPESYDHSYRSQSAYWYNHHSEVSTAYDISTLRSSSCPPIINSSGVLGYETFETHHTVFSEHGLNAAYDAPVFVDNVNEFGDTCEVSEGNEIVESGEEIEVGEAVESREEGQVSNNLEGYNGDNGPYNQHVDEGDVGEAASNLENPNDDFEGTYNWHTSYDNSQMFPETYDHAYRQYYSSQSASDYTHQWEYNAPYQRRTFIRSSNPTYIISPSFEGYVTRHEMFFEHGPNGAAFDESVFFDDVGEDVAECEFDNEEQNVDVGEFDDLREGIDEFIDVDEGNAGEAACNLENPYNNFEGFNDGNYNWDPSYDNSQMFPETYDHAYRQFYRSHGPHGAAFNAPVFFGDVGEDGEVVKIGEDVVLGEESEVGKVVEFDVQVEDGKVDLDDFGCITPNAELSLESDSIFEESVTEPELQLDSDSEPETLPESEVFSTQEVYSNVSSNSYYNAPPSSPNYPDPFLHVRTAQAQPVLIPANQYPFHLPADSASNHALNVVPYASHIGPFFPLISSFNPYYPLAYNANCCCLPVLDRNGCLCLAPHDAVSSYHQAQLPLPNALLPSIYLDEVVPIQIDPDHVVRDLIDPRQNAPFQIYPDQIDPYRIALDRINYDRIVPDIIDPGLILPVPIDPYRIDDYRMVHDPIVEIDPAQIDPYPVVPFQINPDEIDAFQIDPNQIDPNQIDPYRMSPIEIDPDRINSYPANGSSNHGSLNCSRHLSPLPVISPSSHAPYSLPFEQDKCEQSPSPTGSVHCNSHAILNGASSVSTVVCNNRKDTRCEYNHNEHPGPSRQPLEVVQVPPNSVDVSPHASFSTGRLEAAIASYPIRSASLPAVECYEQSTKCSKCGETLGLVLCVGCNTLQSVYTCGCYADRCFLCESYPSDSRQNDLNGSQESDSSDDCGSLYEGQTMYFYGSRCVSNCSGNCSSGSDDTSDDVSSKGFDDIIPYDQLLSSTSLHDDTTVSSNYDNCSASYNNTSGSNVVALDSSNKSKSSNKSPLPLDKNSDDNNNAKPKKRSHRKYKYHDVGDLFKRTESCLLPSSVTENKNIQKHTDYSCTTNTSGSVEEINNTFKVKHYNSPDDTVHQLSSDENVRSNSLPKKLNVTLDTNDSRNSYESTSNAILFGLESLNGSGMIDSGITNDVAQSDCSPHLLNNSKDSLTIVSDASLSYPSSSIEYSFPTRLVQSEHSPSVVQPCEKCGAIRGRVFCPVCRPKRRPILGRESSRTQSCPELFADPPTPSLISSTVSMTSPPYPISTSSGSRSTLTIDLSNLTSDVDN